MIGADAEKSRFNFSAVDIDADTNDMHATLSLHGSLAPKLSGGENNEIFYPQLELHNRESRISQIILIKVFLLSFLTFKFNYT